MELFEAQKVRNFLVKYSVGSVLKGILKCGNPNKVKGHKQKICYKISIILLIVSEIGFF